jgi:hypothetical protein
MVNVGLHLANGPMHFMAKGRAVHPTAERAIEVNRPYLIATSLSWQVYHFVNLTAHFAARIPPIVLM